MDWKKLNTQHLTRMQNTPRLKKRMSLSLHRRTTREASPNHILEERQTTSGYSNCNKISINAQKSPSVTSFSSDAGIECTPPHKKYNLDDSVDYSPKCFDTSFSPSGLLSQTLASGSPEVGWKWGRRIGGPAIDTMITTPDSAYAADSSFASVGLSSTEPKAGRSRSDSQLQRFSYEMRREEQRRAVEMQMRRAEKSRADELLKQRCAKLQEQLKEAEERKQREKENLKQHQSKEPALQPFPSATVPEKIRESRNETTHCEVTVAQAGFKLNDTLNDFLNDSDSDCLLLEATQQVESKIIELTQRPNTPPAEVSSAPTVLASTSATKEKRSSLYMKFLEDDSPDDWFLSLDDVILQATQAKKPRTSFQRHHSMPTTNTSTNAAGSAGTTVTATAKLKTATKTTTAAVREGIAASGSDTEGGVSKIKRHASSHALSPSGSTTSYRPHQLHSRK